MKWDYKNSTLQVSNALRQYYSLELFHEPDDVVLDWLNKNQFEHVFLFLIDAMGYSILEKYLTKDSFLLKHCAKTVNSVFPPTTAASTVSILTGKSPAETGHLGWNMYFKEKNDEIILFYSKGINSKIDYHGYVDEVLPTLNIYDELVQNHIPATSVWPIWSKVNPCKDFDAVLTKLLELEEQYKFIYVYWPDLDTLMHEVGIDDDSVKEMVLSFNDKLEDFATKISKNTCFIVLADHSMINVRTVDIRQYSKLYECIEGYPTLEKRIISFRIKQGTKEKFVEEFQKYFKDSFILFTHDEMIDSKLFGDTDKTKYQEYIGDFVALSISDLELTWSDKVMKGDHAGGLEIERIVPVILVP